MAENFGALTDMWMLDPTMFDPTQKSNQFSNFNDAPLPWPPTYNTGAGGPTNAMGQPIQAFQQWQAANPAGMNINQTPAQPQPPQQPMGQMMAGAGQPGAAGGAGGQINYAGMGSAGSAVQELMNNYQMAQSKLTPQQQYNQQQGNAYRNQMLQRQDYLTASANAGGGGGRSAGGAFNPGPSGVANIPMGQGAPAQAAPSQAAPTGGAPNNWQAALNALSSPGNPQTPGATVPQVSGYQPAGGVNNAYLQSVQGQPGMNQNFLSALNAIQGRPQQQAAAMPQQQPRRWG